MLLSALLLSVAALTAYCGELSKPDNFVQSGRFALSKNDNANMKGYINAMKAYVVEPEAPAKIKDVLNRVKGHGVTFEKSVYPHTINQARVISVYSAQLISAFQTMEKLTLAMLDSGAFYTIGEYAQRKPEFKAVVDRLKALQSVANTYKNYAQNVFNSIHNFVRVLDQDRVDLDQLAKENPETIVQGLLRKRSVNEWSVDIRDAKEFLKIQKRFFFKEVLEVVITPFKPIVNLISKALMSLIHKQQAVARKMIINIGSLQTSIKSVLPSLQRIKGGFGAISDDITIILDTRPVKAGDLNQSVFPFLISIARQAWADVKRKADDYVNSASG